MIRNSFFFLLATCLLFSCSDDFKKTPVDALILKMNKEKDFTIILHDMDVEGSWSKTYKHKYKIVTNEKVNDTTFKPKEKVTDWMLVDENFFDIHAGDLGMEIAAKTDGKVSKQTAPPGYSNYVGNSRYGNWQTGSGGSFWAFYGQYAFMSSMMGLHSGPVYRTGYNDYRSNYRGTSRPYRGKGGSQYGTFSSASKKSNPGFHQRVANNSSFKSRVNNGISNSASARSTRTRAGSRYSSGSSRSRSFSGGGK